MKTTYLKFSVGLENYLIPKAQVRYAERIRACANNNDIIHAGAAMRLFKGRPELHHSMTLNEAYYYAGFKKEEA